MKMRPHWQPETHSPSQIVRTSWQRVVDPSRQNPKKEKKKTDQEQHGVSYSVVALAWVQCLPPRDHPSMSPGQGETLDIWR